MFSKALFPVFVSYVNKSLQSKVLGLNSSPLSAVPNIDFVRYAARKGTRAKRQAKLRAIKLKKQNQKAAEIPKFLVRKVKILPELERRRCTDENWLEAQPIDNVWNMKLYRGKPYSFAEAIRMHREVHAPEILNDPSAIVYANVELDLKLKKNNRFLESMTGIINFPHEFVPHKRNKIVAISKEVDDQTAAIDAGAVFAGSTALIKQILAGTVAREDFDYVVCHPDMLKDLNVLRGLLARKFPNLHNGMLRLDIAPAVKSFINGIEYNLKTSAFEPDFGWVDIPIGRLDMSDQHLEENLQFALNTVEKHKPQNTDHILFVIRTLICCFKSREKFKIPHWNYLKNYPENGVIVEEDDEVEESQN